MKSSPLIHCLSVALCADGAGTDNAREGRGGTACPLQAVRRLVGERNMGCGPRSQDRRPGRHPGRAPRRLRRRLEGCHPARPDRRHAGVRAGSRHAAGGRADHHHGQRGAVAKTASTATRQAEGADRGAEASRPHSWSARRACRSPPSYTATDSPALRRGHGQESLSGDRLLRRPDGIPRSADCHRPGSSSGDRPTAGRLDVFVDEWVEGWKQGRPGHRHRNHPSTGRHEVEGAGTSSDDAQTEERRITGVGGRQAISPAAIPIRLDKPLAFSHYAEGRFRAEVAQPQPQRRGRVGRSRRGPRPHHVPPEFGRLDQLCGVPPPWQSGTRRAATASTSTWPARPCAAAR